MTYQVVTIGCQDMTGMRLIVSDGPHCVGMPWPVVSSVDSSTLWPDVSLGSDDKGHQRGNNSPTVDCVCVTSQCHNYFERTGSNLSFIEAGHIWPCSVSGACLSACDHCPSSSPISVPDQWTQCWAHIHKENLSEVFLLSQWEYE